MRKPVEDENVILRVEDLRHSFGKDPSKVHALRGVSLSAKSGDVASVMGPSGCGKSTMLYLLGLLDRPDSGEIYFKGKPMAAADDRERTALRNKSIGFVFQFHFLIQEFTSRENVALPLRKLGWSNGDSLTRADELLEQLGLADKAHRHVNKLSGGEQQRVAIGRALANSPDLILADEPTGNLDSENSKKVSELLFKFAKENGPAVIVVTHNRELAKSCDRCLPMQDGRFVEA